MAALLRVTSIPIDACQVKSEMCYGNEEEKTHRPNMAECFLRIVHGASSLNHAPQPMLS